MKQIKDYLNSVTSNALSEQRGDAVVFTFGRFNPPTSGHEKLIDAVKRIAKRTRAEHRIYPSHSVDPKKNPLKHSEKIKYMRKFYRGANVVDDKSATSPFHAAKAISDQGYKHVILVVGGDRVDELDKLMRPYINHSDPKKSFNFDKFEVISAGKRDPDAEGVSGMSASKMRAAAGSGDLESFKRGLPSAASDKDARDLFNILRKRMNIKESLGEDAPCWDTHVQRGMKKKNGRLVPNCVPKNEALEEDMKGILKRLKRMPSVIKKIKDTANLSAAKAAASVLAIPAVAKLMTPDTMRNGATLVTSLRSVLLGENTLLREPEILDRLVQQLQDKGIEKNRAFAIATSQLQKNGILKKGTQDLTKKGEKRNSMSAAERAKDRAAKKDGNKPEQYKYNPQTNIATKKEDRDYKKEYDNYHGKPEQIKRRAKRVQARRDLEKQGRVSKGDGKDIDHKDGNPLNNSKGNLRVTSVAHNRSRNNNKEETAKGSAGKKQLEIGKDETLKVYSGAVPGQKKAVMDFLKRGKK